MGASLTFNDTVAARTRAAEHIQNTPDLLALYEKHGGLGTDLTRIMDAGRRAELLTHARGAVEASGTAATLSLLESFAALQSEYVAVMAVVQAVALDLETAEADTETQESVAKILKNESRVVIRTVENEDEEEKKKVAVKSKSQDALRAEIQKDASALLELPVVLDALSKRNVTKDRLEKLRDAAKELAGMLAERAAAKGAGKDATKEIREAVKDQKRVWSACYRILALVGHADERVRNLLADAAA